jgi:hypothetical protein
MECSSSTSLDTHPGAAVPPTAVAALCFFLSFFGIYETVSEKLWKLTETLYQVALNETDESLNHRLTYGHHTTAHDPIVLSDSESSDAPEPSHPRNHYSDTQLSDSHPRRSRATDAADEHESDDEILVVGSYSSAEDPEWAF